ncbi:MAG: zinc dependent phospholipase C family protein [Sedimentibacter sp.]
MPTTYAHYSFGKQVINLLNEDLKKIISNNMDLFNIGLHGPDVLFYYKPLKSNDISKIGHEIHNKNAVVFFENAKSIISECDDFNGACAYIVGFICHYMLDSQCHPYIGQQEKKWLSHSEIEVEFDRVLMMKDNLDSLAFIPTSHIVPSENNAQCISMFFEGTDKKIILKALKSMKFYLNLLVAPGHLKRFIIIEALRISGNYESLSGLIMKYEPEESSKKTNEKLLDLYGKAVVPTGELINEYYQNIKNHDKINERFNRNFG